VVNSFEENDCKNANTYAHGDVHMVVLAHLRRQWSLRDREGFRVLSLPPTELARPDSGVFEENAKFPLRRRSEEVARSRECLRNTRRTLAMVAIDVALASVGLP
jgi:hypothetical protein